MRLTTDRHCDPHQSRCPPVGGASRRRCRSHGTARFVETTDAGQGSSQRPGHGARSGRYHGGQRHAAAGRTTHPAERAGRQPGPWLFLSDERLRQAPNTPMPPSTMSHGHARRGRYVRTWSAGSYCAPLIRWCRFRCAIPQLSTFARAQATRSVRCLLATHLASPVVRPSAIRADMRDGKAGRSPAEAETRRWRAHWAPPCLPCDSGAPAPLRPPNVTISNVPGTRRARCTGTALA